MIISVDEEYLGLAVVGGLDGGATFDDGADLELDGIWSLFTGGLQLRAGLKRSVELVVVALGIAIGVGGHQRTLGDVQLLAVSGDGDSGHKGNRLGISLGKSDAVEVEESLRTLRLLGTTAPLGLLRSLYLRTLNNKVDGMFASQSFKGRH